MDCGFNINHVLPDELTMLDARADFWKNTSVGGGREFLRQEISTIIDRIGEGSAQSQGLLTPITTAAKLRASDHKLYILKDPKANQHRGGVIGYIKTGRKPLTLSDGKGVKKEYQPLCLLDLFVEPSYQRKGHGAKLLNHVLEREDVTAADLAIDRPSAKCLSFFGRNYQLHHMVKQPSHFVVFTEFFERNAGLAAFNGGAGELAPKTPKYHNDQNLASNGGGYRRESLENAPEEIHFNGQVKEKLSNGHGKGDEAHAAGLGGCKSETDGMMKGALRQTKGPNLHYAHTQLW